MIGKASRSGLETAADGIIRNSEPDGLPGLSSDVPMSGLLDVPHLPATTGGRDTMGRAMEVAFPGTVIARADGEPDEEAELDAFIAETTSRYGLTVPKPPKNRCGDKDRSNAAITIIGKTLAPQAKFRMCGYYQDDRALHTHLVGATGAGKSTLLVNMIAQDIWFGRGGMLIDPHGDLAEKVLMRVPPWAIRNVIYLDFGNREHFVGLNALEVSENADAEERQKAVDSVIDLMRRQFDLNESGSPRLMKYLRNALMSLVFTPGMTVLDVMPLFTDPIFREAIQANISDDVLKSWWKQRFDQQGKTKIVDETNSLENKVDPMMKDYSLKNIVGQSRSTIDFADAMDSGKFIIVNLSKGNTSSLLRNMVGTILVSKVYKAAMSRQGRFEEEDRLRFALIVDEFQNFLTKDFAEILEEARKYGLALTLAHQTIGQLDQESELKKSLATNVANRITYSLPGPEDASYFSQLMEPMSKKDLTKLERYTVAVKLMQDGARNKDAFTVATLPDIKMFPEHARIRQYIVDRSIRLYTKDKESCIREAEERSNYGKMREFAALSDNESDFVMID